MVNNLPEWNNEGIEPPASLKNNGWQVEDKPPAPYFNWYMNRTYVALLAAKTHFENRANPHNVNKSQVGLGNVTNALQATKTEFDDHVKSTLHTPYAVATGSANAIVLTIPTLQTLPEGQAVRFKIQNANTGAVTLNVNNLGAKPILRANGMALNAGALRIGGIYTVCYSGTNFTLQGEGGEFGTATATDVLVGKTIGTDGGLVNGAIPINYGQSTELPAGAEYTIPHGYHAGDGTVRARPLALQTTGTALAAQILAGKTAWVNGQQITGTIVDRTGYINSLAADETLNLPDGYYKNAKINGHTLSSQTQATATTAQILAGQTAWVWGNKFTGIMPDYSRAKLGNSYVEALSVSVDAVGSLVIEPRNGYYESGKNEWGFGSIRAYDPDFIAANIVAGKSIFNILGTANAAMLGGLRKARGTSPYNANSMLVISDLAFRPKIVAARTVGNSSERNGLIVYVNTTEFSENPGSNIAIRTTATGTATVTTAQVTENGITLAGYSGSYEWVALG